MIWPDVQLKRLVDAARPITYGIVQAGPNQPDGVPYVRPVDMSQSSGIFDYGSLQRTSRDIAKSYSRSTIAAGDLVVSIGPSYGKILIVPDLLSGANLTQGTARVAPATGAHSKFLFWALQASSARQFWDSCASGATFRALNLEPLGRTPVPLPPVEEQRRIADFLDAETARIDRLTTASQRATRLLAERRTAGVTAAIAGAEHKDRRESTLAWLETLPAGWPEVRLGLVARMGSGHTPSRSHPEWWVGCTIPWITTGEVSQVRDDRVEEICETREKISELGLANSAAELHPKGTVFLCRTASAGYSGVMGLDMATSQDFVTWTCEPQLDAYYLLWCLRAMRPDLLGRLAMGSTHKTIYVPDLQMLRIPLPPLDEQKRIVLAIRRQNTQIDAITDKLRRQQELLAERRQALITAAVTGQFDVSSASGRGLMDGVSA